STPCNEALGQRDVPGPQCRVHEQDTLETVRHVHWDGKAQQPAPVLADQRDPLQIEPLDEVDQTVAMKIETIDRLVDRLVRAAESKQVRRQDAVSGADKNRNHAS